MKIQRTNRAGWASLPSDIFSQIARRLSYLEDLFRLRTVCKSWNLTVTCSEKPLLGLKSPLLMLVEEGQTEGRSIEVKEYMEINEFSSKFTLHVWKLELSPPRKRCFGIKFGWLLTVDMDSKVYLVHPISKDTIPLPACPIAENLLDPELHYLCDSDGDSGNSDLSDSSVPELLDISDTSIWKAALSSNPLEDITSRRFSGECVVMGIFSNLGMLAFARVKDKVWTRVDSVSHHFVDVIHFKGMFCCINKDGALFVCDIDEENPRATEIASVETEEKFEKYLVESSGDLYLVLRGFTSGVRRTVPTSGMLNSWPHDIQVYRLEECSSEESGYCLEREDYLGNSAFMLGASSVSSLTPGIKGCFKRNRIFVTDDAEIMPPYGLAIFDLGDGSFEGRSQTLLPRAEGLPLSSLIGLDCYPL